MFPPGNLFYVSTVKIVQIMEYKFPISAFLHFLRVWLDFFRISGLQFCYDCYVVWAITCKLQPVNYIQGISGLYQKIGIQFKHMTCTFTLLFSIYIHDIQIHERHFKIRWVYYKRYVTFCSSYRGFNDLKGHVQLSEQPTWNDLSQKCIKRDVNDRILNITHIF